MLTNYFSWVLFSPNPPYIVAMVQGENSGSRRRNKRRGKGRSQASQQQQASGRAVNGHESGSSSSSPATAKPRPGTALASTSNRSPFLSNLLLDLSPYNMSRLLDAEAMFYSIQVWLLCCGFLWSSWNVPKRISWPISLNPKIQFFPFTNSQLLTIMKCRRKMSIWLQLLKLQLLWNKHLRLKLLFPRKRLQAKQLKPLYFLTKQNVTMPRQSSRQNYPRYLEMFECYCSLPRLVS